MLFAEDGADDGSRATVQSAFVYMNFRLAQFQGFGALEIVTEDFCGVKQFYLLGAAGRVLELGRSESLKNQQAAGLQGCEEISVNLRAYRRRQMEEDADGRIELPYRPVPGG